MSCVEISYTKVNLFLDTLFKYKKDYNLQCWYFGRANDFADNNKERCIWTNIQDAYYLVSMCQDIPSLRNLIHMDFQDFEDLVELYV